MGDALEEGGERVDAALALQADRDPDCLDRLPQEAHEDAPQEGVVRECPLVWCCQVPQVHVTPPSLRRSRQGHTHETPPGFSVRGWTVPLTTNQAAFRGSHLGVSSPSRPYAQGWEREPAPDQGGSGTAQERRRPVTVSGDRPTSAMSQGVALSALPGSGVGTLAVVGAGLGACTTLTTALAHHCLLVS